MTGRLIHLNGAPGVGKSTIARGRHVVLPRLLADPVELERFVVAATGVGGTYTGIPLGLPDVELARRWRGRDTAEPTTASSNRVIAAHGGDGVVLGRASRLRGEFAARIDVTVVEMDGLDVEGSLVRIEEPLSRVPAVPA